MNVDAWRHYLRARALQALRRPQRAEQAYRDALAADAGFARAAHALAYLLGHSGRYPEAEAVLRRLLAHHPADARAWYNLGYVCDRQGRAEAATEAFGEAVRIDPRLDHAWFGLGLRRAAAGDPAAALAAFEHVLALQPMNWPAWYELGMAHHRLQQHDLVRDTVEHLNRYDRHRARQLILDTGRTDLAYLVADLKA